MNLKQESLKQLCSIIWSFSFSIVVNSFKANYFERRFPGCIRSVFYVRELDILVIIFWFSFNAMCLGKNNGNVGGTKKCFFISNPF